MKKSNHIQEYVKVATEEITTQAIDTSKDDVTALFSSVVKLTGDVVSPSVMFGDASTITDENINVTATVLPDRHKHDIATLNITHTSESNKIVRRDSSGNIFATGSSTSNTGYKLSNGNDIATLFQITGVTTIEPVNEDTNSSSGNNVITGLYLSKNGTQLKLYRTYGWVCNCNSHPYCNCCC